MEGMKFGNLQLDLEAKNIDDFHRDVLKVKATISEEKIVCEIFVPEDCAARTLL